MWLKISTVVTLIAVALGIRLGLELPHVDRPKSDKVYICQIGHVIERLIVFIVLFYIPTHLVKGLDGLRFDPCRTKIALRAAVYYTLTSFLTVLIGLLLVVLFQPSVISNISEKDTEDEAPRPFATVFEDMLRNMIPTDFILVTFQQYKTRNVKCDLETEGNVTTTCRELQGGYVEGGNILGFVISFIIIGICLREPGVESRFLVGFTNTISGFTSQCIDVINIGLFPLALVFLTIEYVYEVGLDEDIFILLAELTAAVISGLIIHGAVILPLIYFAFTRRNPFVFLKGVRPALLSAVCPIGGPLQQRILYCCEEVNRIDKRITLPMLGVRGYVNTDGTALYQVIAIVFISTVSHVNIPWNQLVTLSVVVAASYRDTRNSEAQSSFIFFLFHVLGIPVRDVWPLMIVHWALAWLSTSVDVLGYCIGAGVNDHLSRKELDEQQETQS